MASKEFIAKLKESIDIVNLVSETVQLRRSGKYLTGLSPFTKEKSPSFFVNPENQGFYCYSTNQGGDIITFIELTKGFSFRESIQYLADKAGLQLDEEKRSPEQLAQERQASEEKKQLFKLNRFAARFYQEVLEGPDGGPARDYVQKRAITQESVLGFAIGYAPDSWTALRDYFLKIQAPMLKAHALGLFRTKGGEPPKADGSNLFDTFRNRLVFPIRDLNGEVLGFGGRWLGPPGSDAPKYLNSPESVVYEKEKVLYNLDQAKKSIRELESVVLVEGYMDCLSLVQAGFPNVVANCGTALTRTQASMLRKLAPKVICLYDSDNAGKAATERAMNLFLDNEGFPLLMARLPDGKDPDEFLRAHDDGSLQMAGILQNAPAALDLWIEKRIADAPTSLQARTEILDKIASKLGKLRDELWIQARLPGVVKGLGIELELLTDAIRRYRKGFVSSQEKASSGPNSERNVVEKRPAIIEKSRQIQARSVKKDVGFERRFLSGLVKFPSRISDLRKHESGEVLPFVSDPQIKQAFALLFEPLTPGETEESRLQRLREDVREQPLVRNLVAEAMVAADDALAAPEVAAAILRLKEDALKRQEADLQQLIREGTAEDSEQALAKLMELRRQRAGK
ncbi:MAG: DNA primase [Bdellovibrionota bacterium]